MPVYDSDMTLEKMQDLVDAGAKCSDDGGALVIAWGGAIGYDGYILRCGNDINHTGIEREAVLSPADIPGFNLYDANKKRRKAMQENEGNTALTIPDENQLIRDMKAINRLTKPCVTGIIPLCPEIKRTYGNGKKLTRNICVSKNANAIS